MKIGREREREREKENKNRTQREKEKEREKKREKERKREDFQLSGSKLNQLQCSFPGKFQCFDEISILGVY